MSAVVLEQGAQHGGGPDTAGALRALVEGDGARTIAFGPEGAVTLSTFLGHVRGVAALLPDAPFALNLCEDRYRFLVAFCAVAMRGQTTLLPPSRTRGAIDDVRSRHPDSYCVGDRDDCGCDAPHAVTHAPAPPHYVRLPDVLPTVAGDTPQIALDALVAIGFTPRPGRRSARARCRICRRLPTCTAMPPCRSSRPYRRSTCMAWRCRCC